MRFFISLILACSSLSAQTEKISFMSSGKKISADAASGQIIASIGGDEKKKAILEKAGYKIIQKLSDLNYLVSFSTGIRVNSALSALENLGISVSPNRVYRLKSIPNDPSLSSQYYLSKISAYSAWEYETGYSSTVTVAVVDSGIDSTHPDLASKIHASGNKRISADGITGPLSEDPPNPACYHASAVAAVAASATNNGTGIAGVSWGAKLLSVKIFNNADCNADCTDKTLSGCLTSDAAIIKALNYLKGLHNTPVYGKIVANLSIGGAGNCDSALQAEISDAYSKGIIVVASAGNDYSDVNSPANCSYALPVSATDENDFLAPFSSRGAAMLSGVSAPGVSIYTAYTPSPSYTYDNGTSFSAPVVSGVLALMWSYKPQYSNSQLIDVLKKTSDDLGDRGPDQLYGWGRVNAFRSLLFLSDSLSALGSEKKITAFPNPFYSARDGVINFYVPQDLVTSDMKIQIYDFNGDFITEIKNFSWDGKNSSGASAASGPYIVMVKTDKGRARGKFLLIR